MKYLSMLLLLLLFACSGPKPVYVVEKEAFRLELFDAKCSSEQVIGRFTDMGAPQEVLDSLKAGTVVIKSTKQKLAVCYTKNGPGGSSDHYVFIVDENGNGGYMQVEEMKPMKEDHPGPGMKGT